MVSKGKEMGIFAYHREVEGKFYSGMCPCDELVHYGQCNDICLFRVVEASLIGKKACFFWHTGSKH